MNDATDPRPLLAGVAGDPIGHSKSPVLFRHWFEQCGLSGHYVPLLIKAEDFSQTVSSLARAGFRGMNVTIPHKEAALGLADQASEAAAAIGAANTLTFSLEGEIHADNTDAFGFLENLRVGAPGWNPARSAVLLGAGGAARAAIHILLEAGAEAVHLTNRTRAKAENLAQHFGPKVIIHDWDKRSEILDGAGLIVNSTSLGMTGKAPLEIMLDAAPPDAVVTDMVYAPLETSLLAQAKARGLETVDGLGMLLHQARPGFQRWFGQDPAVTAALRDACLGAGR